MNLNEKVVLLKQEKRVENLLQLQENLKSRNIDKDLNKKLENYLQRNQFLNISREELIEEIVKSDILCSFFMKDPSKQNISNASAAKILAQKLNIEDYCAEDGFDLVTNGLKAKFFTINQSEGAQNRSFDNIVKFCEYQTENCFVIILGDYFQRTENKIKFKEYLVNMFPRINFRLGEEIEL